MKYLFALITSLFFLTGCEDKGYGTQDIDYVPFITSSENVRILSTTPEHNISQKAYISVEFSSYMTLSSLNSENITLVGSDASSIDILIDSNNNMLFIKPLSSLVNGVEYTLSIKKSIEDILGNGLDKDYSRTFLCVADFWQSVEAGDTHSMAKSKEGDIYVWGSNLNKQILDIEDGDIDINSTALARVIPNPIINSNGVLSYSAGASTSTAVTKSQTLFSIGQYNILNPQDTNLSTISSGFNHNSYIKEDGTLWSWGENDAGQLGNAGIFPQLSPTQEFSQDTNWSRISCGNNFTIALKNDGTLWGWGTNEFGQIGDNSSYNERRLPTQESSLQVWSSLSAGGLHSAMIKNDGTIWSFGNNDFGQLGNATTTSSKIPVAESSASIWQSVSAGYSHTCAIKSADKSLWCWGRNYYGQLGNNTTTNSLIAVREDSNSTWVSVSAGKEFTLAVDVNGTLWSWGYNSNHQLGLDNNNTDVLVPTEVK